VRKPDSPVDAYSSPIGLTINPTFNKQKYSNLPFASSLNGNCTNVYPLKINIHEQIYAWRRARGGT
jgi:L-lactate dehydrogenase complex protein LldF